jgi:hypothetical protein
MNTKNDAKKHIAAKVSALPTMLATASVWIGCDAKSNPAEMDGIVSLECGGG